MNLENKRFIHSLVFPSLFLFVIWAVMLSGRVLETDFAKFGIYPHRFEGLIGILLSPLIHADFSHIYANTIPFITLGIGLFYFYNKIAYKIFFLIYFITGTWVWFGAREAYHIGASGIIYGLASFIFFSGIIRRDFRLMSVSLITVFLYGSMIWGVFPIYKKISWESHLMGALAGLILALIYRKEGPQRIKYAWENENDIEENIPFTDDIWNGQKPYNDYTSYMKNKFSERVQKISVNAGFTCPNRDGTKGLGGCIYCNNQTFNPFYCDPDKSVTQQLNEGIAFFSKKYKTQKYLAYFQAYTNTYAPLEKLKQLYTEACSHTDVIGLVIATRADAVDDEKLDYIQSLSKKYYVVVEYGVESTSDNTLQLINRGHTFQESVDAIRKTAARGILTGAHLIIGLPQENRLLILNHAKRLSELPLHTLKLHQLQIIRDTKMEEMFRFFKDWFIVYTADEYIDLVIEFIERLSPSIIVERFISESPLHLIISPNWDGLKNHEIVNKIEKRMLARNTWQGRLYNKTF